MVWFTIIRNEERMTWVSKDNATMKPEVTLTREGKCAWVVREEGVAPVGGESNAPVDAMNAAASYIHTTMEKRNAIKEQEKNSTREEYTTEVSC